MEKLISYYKEIVLSILLTKFEKSTSFKTGQRSNQRPQIALDRKNELSSEYDDEMDHRKKEAIDMAVKELEMEGIIDIAWVKWEEGRLSRIYLNYEKIELAYKSLSRKPKQIKIQEMIEILLPLNKHPWDWVKLWWNEVNERLNSNSTKNISLDEPDKYKDLVEILLALPNYEGGIAKRILSSLILKDSKAFENSVESRLLSILKKYCSTDFETDEEYLDSIGIYKNGEYVYMSGPIKFVVDGFITNFLGLPGGSGLSYETAKRLKITGIGTKKIILIENLTVYQLFVDYNKNNDLVIYTAGYPKKILQLFLKKIYEYIKLEQNITVYHWGDIDYGGIKIFEYIRTNFIPSLKPLYMDVQKYNQYTNRGMTFSRDYEKKLEALLRDNNYREWHALINEMLRCKIRIEQEVMINDTIIELTTSV